MSERAMGDPKPVPRRLPAPADGYGRVETGATCFGDDWNGLFLRGDDAFGLALDLKMVLEYFDQLKQASQLMPLASSPLLKGSLVPPTPPTPAIPGELRLALRRLKDLREEIVTTVIEDGPSGSGSGQPSSPAEDSPPAPQPGS